MKLLLALAASAVGYCYYCGRNARGRTALRKEELHRWEGEGGNVPSVSTPTPATQPAYTGDSGMRH